MARFQKIDWGQGSIELVGFIVCLPMLMIMFIAVLSTAQIAVLKQNIEYASFASCRAAALSEVYTKSDSNYIGGAKERAIRVFDVFLHGDSDYDIEPGMKMCDIGQNIAEDCMNISVAGYEDGVLKQWHETDGEDTSSMTRYWKKGNYVVITYSMKVSTICPFDIGIDEVSAVQAMAIENSKYEADMSGSES